MVAPRSEDEQRLGQRVHRRVQDQLAQALGEHRAAGFAGAQHRGTRAAEALGDGVDVGGLAGTVDAFECDETAGHYCFPRWNLSTARLCAASDSLNSLLPSPRETKYRARVGSGRTAASNEALPGIAIGVGGKPARR